MVVHQELTQTGDLTDVQKLDEEEKKLLTTFNEAGQTGRMLKNGKRQIVENEIPVVQKLDGRCLCKQNRVDSFFF